MTHFLHQDLAEKILKCYYNVYNRLGHGFLEKVYENALMIELNRYGLVAERQKKLTVFYLGQPVGEYFADMIVENKIILELKASATILEEHEYQLVNYLRATEIELGFLLNFGTTPEFKRKLFTNDRKVSLLARSK
jgi:GxxExxY protein